MTFNKVCMRHMTLLFTRQERLAVTTIVALVVQTMLATQADVLSALEAAASKWARETGPGRRAFAHGGGINIGDLITHDAFHDPLFTQALLAAGVRYVDHRIDDGGDAFAFDRELVRSNAMPFQVPRRCDVAEGHAR